MNEWPDLIYCGECYYLHINSQDNYLLLKAGNYCPKCGEELKEGCARNFNNIRDQAEFESSILDKQNNGD